MKASPVDEGIMALRLKQLVGFVSLIAVFALTDTCKLVMKEAFYARLTSVVDKYPR